MKAIRIHQFGNADVLKFEDIERPSPAPDELLIKVFASGVNPVDWVIREGNNEALRPLLKLPLTLGWDAAGIVEDTGSNVTGFKKGDAVYGIPNFPGDGSYAEYCVGKADQFALKPKSLSFNEASAVPLAALTAFTGIFHYGKLKPSQRILIHGASGGVGSFAVQLAKATNAYVIGVASTQNLDYLNQLGADEVIDYKTQAFEDLIKDVDVVFDASPKRDNSDRMHSVKVIKEGGIFVSTNVDFPFNDELKQALAKKQITGHLVHIQSRKDWLEHIAQWIDEGKVKVIISKVYPFTQVADAHHASESWHVRGKLVLQIRNQDHA